MQGSAEVRRKGLHLRGDVHGDQGEHQLRFGRIQGRVRGPGKKVGGCVGAAAGSEGLPIDEDYQAVSQQKTWVSRRTIVTRLPVYTSSEAELRYLANIQRTPWCLTSITNFAVV